MNSRPTGPVWLVVLAAGLGLLGVWLSGRHSSGASGPLVVYCAHDAVYSEQVLRDFESQSGIPLDIRFDTEATKSLGLVQLIARERNQPQCDVFWNNELLGTLELQQQGLLAPYRGQGWERMPEQFRDPDGHWVGFAARLRVWIVNTRQMTADQESIEQLLEVETSRVAMAMPMFGTTLTHYTVLADRWGLERLQSWHAEMRRRGLREVPGNGVVKDVVAHGTNDCGWTDTDDVFVALDADLPVTQLPVRIDDSTIAIPNSVAIIRGTKRQEQARQLVDYLTCAATELRLARSAARQIPLGEVADAEVPAEVRQLRTWAADAVDLRALLPVRKSVLEWLRTEYAP
ncbi:MAG: substrate-binding domain-containing protein [Planctomycetaceae bacterium]|nr:substrate-binding domain-containing protein [Planctomycetaceae bacterium]